MKVAGDPPADVERANGHRSANPPPHAAEQEPGARADERDEHDERRPDDLDRRRVGAAAPDGDERGRGQDDGQSNGDAEESAVQERAQ
jgi:hypothetical protein